MLVEEDMSEPHRQLRELQDHRCRAEIGLAQGYGSLCCTNTVVVQLVGVLLLVCVRYQPSERAVTGEV